MAENEHGGYRRPSNPAPVSGPGSLSRRTDGGPGQPVRELPAGGKYGEAKAFRDAQQAAPRGQSGGGMSAPSQVPLDTSGVMGLEGPSLHPEQPVTAGADMGAGPGLEALGVNPAADIMDPEFKERMRSYMPVLMHLASTPNASRATRQFIRQLRGELL